MVDKSYVFLIIDDQSENIISLKALLKEAYTSCVVISALDGKTGIDLAIKIGPDVIFLDIFMPIMNGYEVCKIFKSDERFQNIPVIFVTAMNQSKESRLKALNSGGDAFLSKPIDEIELVAQVETMLKIKESNLIKSNEKKNLEQLVDKKTIEINKLNKNYKMMLDDLPALISEFLPDSTITYANKAYFNYFDKTREEIVGLKFIEIFSKEESSFVNKKYEQISLKNPLIRFIYSTINGKEQIWHEWCIRGNFDENGLLKHYYSIGIDITQRKLSEDKFVFLSYHDHLTGLFNRRFFSEEMKRLNTSRNLPISIIMGDVNGLKLINDSFGHTMGDELLVEASKAMLKGCREDDVVARIGGDEFAIILTQTNNEDAQEVVKRIIEATNCCGFENAILSISLGVATKEKLNEEIMEVFAKAENLMYKKKIYERAIVKRQTVNVIMKSLFEKSINEKEHSERVSELCVEIAREMNFEFAEINKIKIAGLLHDIGKISIEEQILNKTSKLLPEEWIEMKKHPESGWRILSSIKEFSEIADCVISHHERWDGKGYPNGLKSDEIPLKSRIISVADAFDAMTGNRTYRKSISVNAALYELELNAKTQFDPEIVKVFVEWMRKKNAI